MNLTDTIAAISSPVGQGMKGIVRLSGSRAITIVAGLIVNPKSESPKTGQVAIVIPPDNVIVKADILISRAPHTYTCEDMVEIHTFGSRPLLNMVLEAVVFCGARLAEPGEFTMRAFLNGRVDLAQAEAVMEVINSSSESQLHSGMRKLKGEFSNEIKIVEGELINLCADVEASIDFIEEDISIVSKSDIVRRSKSILGRLSSILYKSRLQNVEQELPTVLLFGPTNSGKSTLFNRLIPDGDAITSEVAGTTRDIISGLLQIDDLCIRLLDSAGILGTQILPYAPQLVLNREAVAITRSVLDTDVILLIVDVCELGNWRKLIDEISGRNYIVVINKIDKIGSDMARKMAEEDNLADCIFISALKGDGINCLKERVRDAVSLHRDIGSHFTLSSRQHTNLTKAVAILRQMVNSNCDSIEFIAFDLRCCLDLVGGITGRIMTDDILSRIFERFCIGK